MTNRDTESSSTLLYIIEGRDSCKLVDALWDPVEVWIFSMSIFDFPWMHPVPQIAVLFLEMFLVFLCVYWPSYMH